MIKLLCLSPALESSGLIIYERDETGDEKSETVDYLRHMVFVPPSIAYYFC